MTGGQTDEGRAALGGAAARSAVPGELLGRSEALSPEDEHLVEVFRALGQRSRFALWMSLAHKCLCMGSQGDYCCVMQKESGLAQSTVSHHLRVLREAGLVERSEQGSWCCYRVVPRVYHAVMELRAKLAGR